MCAQNINFDPNVPEIKGFNAKFGIFARKFSVKKFFRQFLD